MHAMHLCYLILLLVVVYNNITICVDAPNTMQHISVDYKHSSLVFLVVLLPDISLHS